MTTAGLHVLAIVAAGHPGPGGAAGLGDPPSPPRVLREGALAAVVCEAAARPVPRRRDLLAHQEVLDRLAAAGPVIPMRFGTVATDEGALRGHLSAAGRRHLETLRRLTGRTEVNLKALPATDALAALVRQDPTVRRLRAAARERPGYQASLRLGEAVSAALSRRAAEAGREVVAELLPLAVDACPGPEVPGCALNMSFLVEAVDAGRFTAEAARLAGERRESAELRLTGPLPCYSFAASDGPHVAAGV